MGRHIRICFLSLAIVFLIAAMASAQGEGEFFYTDFQVADRLSLGVKSGAAIPRKSKIYNYAFPGGATTIEIEPKNGWWASGILTYDLGDYLATGIEASYMQYEVEAVDVVGPFNIFDHVGKARNIALLGEVFLKYPFTLQKYTFTPYAMFGAGELFTDFKESGRLKNLGDSFSVKDAFAMKYGVGFDIYNTGNIVLNVEAAYLDSEVKTTLSNAAFGSAANDVRNDSWVFGCGLKYRFK
jgi:outer membrane protein W